MRFFIDYENVSSAGLVGIEALTAQDAVVIFYNEQSSISMKMHELLETAKCQKEYIPVTVTAKNALDFQLSSYLGSFTDKEKDFCIVSKDQGFDAVIRFWKRNNLTITRCNNLQRETIVSVEESLQKAFHDDDAMNVKEIAKILGQYKTKQGINNALVKQYGSEKGGSVYKRIKSFISEKK